MNTFPAETEASGRAVSGVEKGPESISEPGAGIPLGNPRLAALGAWFLLLAALYVAFWIKPFPFPGRFQLLAAQVGKDHYVYRLDTWTGKVQALQVLDPDNGYGTWTKRF